MNSLVKIERIEQRLSEGKTIFGTHTVLGNGVISELYGTVGFDVLWVDTEHGCIDRKDVLATIMGAAGTDMATFVRIPWNDMVMAKPILEMGCDGIIFPMVCSAEEARQAVAACEYPPDGIRGFGPYRCIRYGKTDAGEYVNHISKKIWKIIQIEHMKAVENLDEILAVKGIDLFIVGACDLSASMGLLPQTAHPKVKEVLDYIAAKMKAAGKHFGISMGYDEEIVKDWIHRGADFIFVENEINYLYAGATAALGNLRRLSGQGD